jgi:hypothetical protein
MKPGSAMTTAAAIAALSMAGVFGVGALRAVSADADSAQQKLYLDPQTGEVLDAPPAHADDNQPARGKARQRSAPAEAQAWINDEGTEMLTPAPDAQPDRRAVRCDDGTLRMGHASGEHRAKGSDSERDALCERPAS